MKSTSVLHKSLIVLTIILSVCKINAQNYLYEKGKNGISGTVGFYSESFNDLNGYSFNLDFTLVGRLSVGLNNSNFTPRFSDESIPQWGLNASYCIIKKKSGNNTFNAPIILSYAKSKSNDTYDTEIFSYGLGMVFYAKTHDKISIAPGFFVVNNRISSPNFFEAQNQVSFGVEMNIIVSMVKITPSFTLTENGSLFGLNLGFII